jgi:ribosomal protein L40E
MTDTHDLPWDQLTKKADQAIAAGATLYQKFTCDKCGARQTMTEANTFYTEGQCEECQHITDIRKKGGGYLATFGIHS